MNVADNYTVAVHFSLVLLMSLWYRWGRWGNAQCSQSKAASIADKDHVIFIDLQIVCMPLMIPSVPSSSWQQNAKMKKCGWFARAHFCRLCVPTESRPWVMPQSWTINDLLTTRTTTIPYQNSSFFSPPARLIHIAILAVIFRSRRWIAPRKHWTRGETGRDFAYFYGRSTKQNFELRSPAKWNVQLRLADRRKEKRGGCRSNTVGELCRLKLQALKSVGILS